MKVDKILLPFVKYHIPNLNSLPGTKQNAVSEYNNLVISEKWKLHSYKCLCGSNDFSLISTIDSNSAIHPVVMCNHCGLVQENPRFSPGTFKQFYTSDLYEKLYNTNHKITGKFTIASGMHIYRELEKIKPLKKDAKILEIGAGAGWNLLPFIEKSLYVLGMDINEKLVEAGKKYGINVQTGDEFSVNETFDIIILKDILQETPHPVLMLKTLNDKLKDDGLLYAEANNFFRPNPKDFTVGTIFYYTPAILKHFVASAGYIPVKIELLDKNKFFGIFRKGIYKNTELIPENRRHISRYYYFLNLKDRILFSKKLKSFENAPAKIFFDTAD